MKTLINDVVKLKNNTKAVFIYGGGVYGRNVYNLLMEQNIEVEAFLQTECNEDNIQTIYGKKVYCAKEYLNSDNGIIVAMNRLNTSEIKKYLDEFDVDTSNIIFACEYIENGSERLSEEPIVEITTLMGCKVNCKYCPQGILLQRYYENDKNRKKIMDIETFKQCLNKLPLNATVSFCGMSEPFLNKDCLSMIKLSVASGRNVTLFTTLVGTTIEDVKELCELPIHFVTLHIADAHGYANIPITEEYYEKVRYIMSASKADGTPFVNMCSSQMEPEEVIEDICKEKCMISTVLFDRAENLHGENEVISKCTSSGKISCSLCGEKLDHNILLPDGTLLLCCNDYGMKHVLGNLLQNDYEDILHGKEIMQVKKGMNEERIDILCRKCPMAHGV